MRRLSQNRDLFEASPPEEITVIVSASNTPFQVTFSNWRVAASGPYCRNQLRRIQPGTSGDFRDFQLAGKWDIPVGRIPSFIATGTLTFSGLCEHLHQKPFGIDLSINDEKVNKPRNIGVFQAKYLIPLGDSGLQVPISFTASNRTELVQEKEHRGNIGRTFDPDRLFVKTK